jgi:hypothetical protein
MELLRELTEVRDAAEWNRGRWDNLPFRLMCMICELDEVEGAMAAAPQFAAEELADVATYILHTLYDLWEADCPELLRELDRAILPPPSLYASPAQLCAPIRRKIVLAMQKWRLPPDANQEHFVRWRLLEALWHSIALSAAMGRDLAVDVRAEMEKRRGRPARHGGKHPDT